MPVDECRILLDDFSSDYKYFLKKFYLGEVLDFFEELWLLRAAFAVRVSWNHNTVKYNT